MDGALTVDSLCLPTVARRPPKGTGKRSKSML